MKAKGISKWVGRVGKKLQYWSTEPQHNRSDEQRVKEDWRYHPTKVAILSLQ